MQTKLDGIREFRGFSTQTNEISLRTKRIRRKVESLLFLLIVMFVYARYARESCLLKARETLD